MGYIFGMPLLESYLLPLILGVESQDHIEEESIEHTPGKEDCNINPDAVHCDIHGGEHILAYQGACCEVWAQLCMKVTLLDFSQRSW